MKKLLTLALAAVMLFSALPAAFAQNSSDGLVLDSMSALKVNAETGYIENMPEIMTVSELLTNFRDKKDITVTDAKGNALKSTDEVGTDAVISCGDDTLKTLVYGDVNRDCKINMKDISSMIRLLASYDVDIVETAMDVNFDGNRNMKDISAMIRYLAGWNVDIRNHDMLDPLTAPNEDSDIEILFDSIMHRVGATDTEPSDNYTYTLKIAKNEIETLQFFLVSAASKSNLTLEIGDITNENGDILEAEALYGYYYKMSLFNGLISTHDVSDVTEDRFVDPMPKLVNPISLNANESKAFYVKVKTTPDTAAGLYKAEINLKDASGNVIKTAEFRVYVWDFVLDEKPACDTAFGLGYYGINMTDGTPEYTDADKLAEKCAKYYDFLLENRISAYHMPYAVTDSRADKYMSDPRVTSFCVSGGGQYNGIPDITDDELLTIYTKLRTNPDWLDKAYIYLVDEPCDDGLLMVKNQWEWASSVLPEMDFQIMLPISSNRWYNEHNSDAFEFVNQYITTWCPQSDAFTTYAPYKVRREDPENFPSYGSYGQSSEKILETYGQFEDRYEGFRAQGKKMWWYVCIGPSYPYANFFQPYQGYGVRTVLWQQYHYDVDGLLYWTVNDWEKVSKNKTNYGDGLLVYWGSLFGQEVGPVSCVRLEYVRDGIEDFQYLSQLEALTDRETAMKYVNPVTTDILKFSEDNSTIENSRNELGFLLEELYSEK